MQSYYSFYGSQLQLLLDDAVAEGYNRRCEQFYKAQVEHKETHGIPWDPSQPLLMQVDAGAQEAYNKVGSIINLMCEVNGGGLDIPEEDLTDDYLVKVERAN